jgi:regulatory protein
MSMQSPRRPRATKAQRHREKPLPKPLDAAQLDALALAYVARFATSGGKLSAYLARKLRERGWQEDAPPPDLAALVERLAAQGYIDDAGYALAKGQGLLRRGFGARRIEGALMQAGIAAEIREAARGDETERRRAALEFARRKRFWPYAEARSLDRATREKQVGAFLRAGHPLAYARRLADAASLEDAESWADEDEDADY